MGKMQRDKGARVERYIVQKHKDIGVHAVKVPLSGATGYRNAEDVDVYPNPSKGRVFTTDSPLIAEVKAKQSLVPKSLISAMGEADLLFIKPDRQDPYVFMTWETYAELVGRVEVEAA